MFAQKFDEFEPHRVRNRFFRQVSECGDSGLRESHSEADLDQGVRGIVLWPEPRNGTPEGVRHAQAALTPEAEFQAGQECAVQFFWSELFQKNGCEVEVRIGGFRGAPAKYAGCKVLKKKRLFPKSLLLEPGGSSLEIGGEGGFERPPEQERDVDVCIVLGMGQQRSEQCKSRCSREPPCGTGELAADFR